jgi:hypothetical protein
METTIPRSDYGDDGVLAAQSSSCRWVESCESQAVELVPQGSTIEIRREARHFLVGTAQLFGYEDLF